MRGMLLASAIGITTLAIAAFGLRVPPSSAQDTVDQQFGRVHFPTSCNEVAQRRFDRAMRYQHSFWYQQSMEVFEETLKADSGCAIAHWGIALSLWNNPHNPPPAPQLAPALAAIQKAKAIGAKSQRERDFIDALALIYIDHDKAPYRTRLLAYRKAMEALAQRYPDDDEAQIAYAITLNISADPNDKTYAQQLKGAAILEPIHRRLPDHPGVVHYLIHLYDYPALAQKGLEFARSYAKVAPAAPHAQHMPSHIYTRVGAWKESVASNLASVEAGKAHKEITDQQHARDYLVYAYLQLAQDDSARAVVADLVAVTKINPAAMGAHFAVAASPARLAIERSDWAGAMALQVRPTRFPFVDAITHFARAYGAARAGQPAAARPDIARLAELRDALRKANNAYWAEQVDIQHQVASAWVLYAEGRHDEALRMMSAAADAEDKTEKSPVTPGPLAPARELYGAMLLERGMTREALAAFESTQVKEPNRFRGFAGAAQAAERLGDTDKAKANYAKLVALVGDANGRPEITAARRFLGTH